MEHLIDEILKLQMKKAKEVVDKNGDVRYFSTRNSRKVRQLFQER